MASIMKIGDYIKKIISNAGYSLSRLDVPQNPQQLNQISAEHFFDLFFSTVNPDNFFLIQLGANDGFFVDPLHKYIVKYNLAGILVEPQKDVFDELRKTYTASDRLLFENVAISNIDGTRTLYTIKDSYKENEFFIRGTAIASFNKEDFEKSLLRELTRKAKLEKLPVPTQLDDYTEKTTVQTLTLHSLLEKNKVKKIDYLQIDCEGYDYEIIKMIDFQTISPKIINFESKRFTDAQREECESLLHFYGYKVFRHGFDTCAFKDS